ncbi:translocation/assembly module TamB domain-containing protein [Algihabitans albus]|uniref:translocation/assembly module TamB domain-containing protein n=1 Tax=Algihabitans albus TaxID=2164067 RepID=UPI0035CFE17B
MAEGEPTAEGETQAQGEPKAGGELRAERRPPDRPPDPPSGRRRRWIWRGLAALVALPVVSLVLAVAALQTGPGRDTLAGLVEGAVPGLEIGALEGAPPFEIVLSDVTLSDPEGVWLSLDRGRLAWDVAALLGGLLAIEAVELGALDIARAPVAETPAAQPVDTPDDGLGLPSAPPLGLRLERLAVERLSLGPALLGERLDLSIEGRLAAGDAERIDSALRVLRLDGEGEIAARAVYLPPSGRLEAEIEASAPADGLATRLLGLPGAPPLSLRLQGAGPLMGWQGDWSFRAGEIADASGQLTLETFEPLGLGLSGQARLAALLPPDLRALLEPRLDFALSASYGERVGLVLERLETGALDVTGFADLHLTTERLSAQFDATVTDPSALADAIAPVSLSGARVSLVAGGSLAAPELLLSGELEAPAAAGYGADRLRLTAQTEGFPAEFELELSAEVLSGPPPLVEALGSEARVTAQGLLSTAAVRLDRVTVASPALSLSGDGTAEFAGPAADIALTLTYGDLARLAPLAGLDLAGRWQGDAYLSLAADGALSAILSGQAEQLRLGLPAAEALLGPVPTLWADVRMRPDGAVDLESLRLDGAALAVAGQGRLDARGDGVEAELTVGLPDLGALSSPALPLAGAASLEAQLRGSVSRPELILTADAPELLVAGSALRDVSVAARSLGLPPDLTGRIDLAAATPLDRVALGGDLRVDATHLRLAALQLTRRGDALSGDLSVPLAGLPAEGRLSLRIADLGAYAPLVPDLAGGGLAGRLDLAARAEEQAADLTMELRDLRLADGTRLNAAELAASGESLLTEPRLSARLRGSGLRAGTATVDSFAAAAEGALADLAVSFEADGQLEGAEPQPLALATEGRLSAGETLQIAVSRLEAEYGALVARLMQPAQLAFGAGRLRAEGVRLGFNEGGVDLDAEIGGGRVDARVTLRGLPLSLVEAAGADMPLEGRLQGEASLTGPLPRPEGRLRLRTEGLRFAERVAEETPPLDLEVDGRLTAGRLRAEGRLSGFAADSLEVTAELPLLLSDTPLAVAFPQDQPISAVARWSGDLAPIVGLLPIDVVRIEGQGDLDLALNGTLAVPRARGALTVVDGLYENFTLGTLLQPFDLRVEGDGSRLVLRGFNAQDGDGGRLSASGWLDLAGEVPRFQVDAEAGAATFVRRDDLIVQLSSRLSLAGDLDAATLAGEIESDRIEVSLAGQLPPSVVTLDVEEINNGEPQAAAEPAGPDQGLAFLGLDVGIAIPGRLFVRGRGLDSEWRGTFRVSGTAADPRLLGDLRPVRGLFDFAGRRFDLEQGSIAFAGGADLDPQLDLRTVYRDNGFLARIAITGPASAPVFALSSEPSLPEDEILSRILFGEGTARLTAAQAVQLAQAAAALTGGGGGGLLDVARDTLGVDVLTIAPGVGEDDLGQVEAGRYLADGLFFGVRQGATPGSSSAVVEWEVTPNLTLESEVGGATRDSNVGFSWQWDY